MRKTKLTRRSFIKTIAAAGTIAGSGVLSGCLESNQLNSKQTPKPNFVFIMTDDQKWDAVGFEKKYPFLQTPYMDKLAQEGAVFKNAFVTTSLCSPSRACCLTGMYAHDNGVPVNEFNDHRTDVPSLQSTLKQQGYEVAFIGKWHQKPHANPRPNFDYWLSFEGQGKYFNPELNENGKEIKSKGYITDILTDYAEQWLEEKRDKSKPFCLFIWHKAIHSPFTPAPGDEEIYEEAMIPQPANYNDNYSDKGSWLRHAATYGIHRYDYYDNQDKPAPKSTPPEEKWDPKEEKWKNYLETIPSVDKNVGRIYELLKTNGILDDTFFMFTSDNGYLLGNHHCNAHISPKGVSDKRIMWEDSIKIPLIIRYPKLINPNTVIEKMVLNIDFAPTFIELAGNKVPETMQGMSFVPLLKGQTENWRTEFMYEYFREGYVPGIPSIVGIRTDRYKLISYPDLKNNNELYDLEKDPLEMQNLYNDTKHAELQAELTKRLEKLKTKYNYTVPDYPRG